MKPKTGRPKIVWIVSHVPLTFTTSPNILLQTLVLTVLDSMMEKLEGQHDTYIVHYSVLDGDRQGRPPNDPHFDKAHKSCLHKIAKSNNKASVIPSV